MAEIRSSILKIIQVVSFLVYLYNVISSYMKYDTMTNVNRIRERKDLPAIGYAFCMPYSQILRPNHSVDGMWFFGTYDEKYLTAATKGIDELQINLTMNGRKVVLKGSPYAILNYKCWPFDPPFEFYLEDEMFLVEIGNQNIPMAISRNLNHLVRLFIHYPVFMFSPSRDLLTFDESMVIKQLPFPYKTNCKRYNVSQLHCLIYCFVRIPGDTLHAKKCLKKCIEGDCSKLMYRKRFGSIDSKDGMRTCFGSDYLSIITYPFLPLSLFIQQIVGLITMFFEISISDVADYTFRRLRQLIANILKYFTKCRKRYFIIASIKHILIYFGCFTHIIFSTRIYLQYRISTESFVGSPTIDYSPTFGICFYMEDQWNGTTTFEDVRNDNSLFREIANVSSSGVQSYDYRAYRYYETGKICFALDIAHNTRFKREMIRVEFIRLLRNSLSIDFFVKYPMTHSVFSMDAIEDMEFESEVIDLINLPSPFESNCLDYKSVGTPSRKACHNSCLLDWYRKNGNQLPYNVINSQYSGMRMGSNYPNYSICHEKCRNLDCHETKLNLVEKSYVRNMIPRFQILNPTNVISSELIPNQSLVDFITFTTSILTLWFGLSGISIIDVLGSTKITKKYKPEISPFIWLTLICCFNYHMYQLLSGYLSYQVVPSVKFGESGSINLPSVSVVFEFNNRTSKSGVHNIPDIETMSPFKLNHKFHESKDLIPGIELPNQQDFFEPIKLNISEIANITYASIVSNLKVITFDLEALDRNLYTFHTNAVKSGSIKIAFQFDNRIRVRTISKKSDIHSFVFHHHRYHRLDVNNRKSFYFNHQFGSHLQKSVLLKYPYSSKCIDYSYPLKSDSYESCMIKNHVKVYDKIPYSITVPAAYNYSRMAPNDEIVTKCHRTYSVYPFCETTSYSFDNLIETPNYRADTFQIVLPKQITSCILSPKTTVRDLIILIGDVFGLWLGISIFFILEKIISYTKCVNFDDFLVAV